MRFTGLSIIIFVMMVGCSDQSRQESPYWQYQRIESANRFIALNLGSQREFLIELCGIVPTQSPNLALKSQQYLKQLLESGKNRLIIVGNGSHDGILKAEVNLRHFDNIELDSRSPMPEQEEISVNALMLQKGMADYQGGCQNDVIYQELVKEAKHQKIGIWKK